MAAMLKGKFRLFGLFLALTLTLVTAQGLQRSALSQALDSLDSDGQILEQAEQEENATVQDDTPALGKLTTTAVEDSKLKAGSSFWVGYVNSSAGVNVRKSPWGALTGNLEYLEEITVTGTSGEWYKFSQDGAERYVFSKYISRKMSQQQEAEEKVKAFVSSTSSFGGRPVAGGRVSSPFGYRIHPIKKVKKLHKGVDFAVPGGTTVKSMGTGKVVHAGWMNGYGYTVKILHDNGFVTLYAHLKKGSLKVKVGQRVEQSAAVAAVNNSGASAGNHLHFEVQKAGKPVDPASIPGVVL